METKYIHGTSEGEQTRLAKLNSITNEAFKEFIGDCHQKKVCDFGSGLGILVDELAREYPAGEFTGVEIAEKQYLVACDNNSINKNVTLVNRDGLKSGLPDDYFDITYCRYFLEHVSDPVAMVKEMVRVTKPGGKILCQENDLYNAILHPPIEGYDRLRKAFCNLQSQMGGDPNIGRKLYDLFKNTSVQNIELSYAPEIFTEKDEVFVIWLENMLNILKVAEEMVIDYELASKEELYDLYSSIESRIEKPFGVSYFHWNRIMAFK